MYFVYLQKCYFLHYTSCSSSSLWGFQYIYGNHNNQLGFTRNDHIFAQNLRNFRANPFFANFCASLEHEAQ